jgi:hypothetical protein
MGRRDARREVADMREGVLFGTMFGLGVAAVAIGVTVSRLVVGPAPDGGAEAPAAALETLTPAVSRAGPSVAQPPEVAPSAPAETPEIAPAAAAATSPRPRRALLPGFARPPASVPASGDQPVAPSPSAGDGGPIAVVRSGQALPAAPGSARRANGARIIRIDPDGR